MDEWMDGWIDGWIEGWMNDDYVPVRPNVMLFCHQYPAHKSRRLEVVIPSRDQVDRGTLTSVTLSWPEKVKCKLFIPYRTTKFKRCPI